MSYTARSVTASSAPWPLTIGEHTHWARPLSAAFVLRVVPKMVDAEQRTDAIREALRAAFPLPRWRWQRDALRAIAGLTQTVQASIVEQMFAIPGATPDGAEDPEAALIAAHRKLAHPTEETRQGPTLALAALTCEVRMGAAWYYAPDRWPTSDGYAPLATVWTTYAGLAAIDAQDRLQMASAVQLANGHGPTVAREWRKVQAAAYPPDPTMRGAH